MFSATNDHLLPLHSSNSEPINNTSRESTPHSTDSSNTATRIEATVQRCFPSFRSHSFVSYLTATQVILFAITKLASFFDKHEENKLAHVLDVSACSLYRFGSTYGPGVRFHYQLYRLVLPLLLHANVFHLVVNLLCQMQLMLALQQPHDGRTMQGTRQGGAVIHTLADNGNSLLTNQWLIGFYLSCGVVANFGSMVFKPNSIAVGASGALFGLMGYLCVELRVKWDRLDQTLRRARLMNLGAVLALNTFVSLSLPMVDGWAHFWGFFFGVFSALLFIKLSGHDVESELRNTADNQHIDTDNGSSGWLSEISGNKWMRFSILGSAGIVFGLCARFYTMPMSDVHICN